MRIYSCFVALVPRVTTLIFIMLIAACGGGHSPDPAISILVPTAAPNYETTSTVVRIGGSISGAGFAHVVNTTTGFSTEAYLTYNNDGFGSWFADVPGLVPGDNLITVTADAYGDSTRTAVDSITVSRPLQPLSLIINAADSTSAAHYWIDVSSYNQSHKIALFADGTGISTTGNVLSEDAGATVVFTWSILGPEAIQINNCPTCSFQQITRISGSVDEGQFFGQVETVGGDGEIALHAFLLEPGTL